MKALLIVGFILIYLIGDAQSLINGVDFPLSKADIIKLKIAKIVTMDSGTSIMKQEYYFDRDGNDTAIYNNGSLFQPKNM